MPTSSCSWLSSDDLPEVNYEADEADERQSTSVTEVVQRGQV